MDQSSFKLTSKAFNEGEFIPINYTGQGKDVNPQLAWENTPSETQSLAFIVDDPDAPCGLWTHWLVKNIPANITEIKENTIPGKEVINSWGCKKWKGPKPPSGTHRYYFKLYALNKKSMDATTLDEFYEECEKSKIGEAVLMGQYTLLKKK